MIAPGLVTNLVSNFWGRFFFAPPASHLLTDGKFLDMIVVNCATLRLKSLMR
jgi:hypothetical protein